MTEFPKIGDFQPKGKFFLAPMEAVNCASFRLLCKDRGAAVIYTDMIDADKFAEFAKEKSVNEAVKKYVNPQNDEQPLVIQLGSPKAKNILFCVEALKDYCVYFDLNIGCPLGYMLGKKGGCYLMKHTDQLYKLLRTLRENIKKPLTIKIRSGWDENSLNALEIAKEAEKIGIDAITIHGRTKEQGYKDKSDWSVVRKIKQEVKIPVILSGDVFNSFSADKAFNVTKCDYIMLARAAQANPSVFTQLNKWYKDKIITSDKTTIYNKREVNPTKDFMDFLDYYKKKEGRYSFSELKDHALWTAKECRNNREVTQKIINAKDEQELLTIIRSLYY